MKRNLLTIAMSTLLALVSAAAPATALQVQEFVLNNGMKVWVNVDHSQPKVFGAVVVNAGAVDCPNTGIAHYFEHIMFKGTDELGTVDYAAEKVYLDSISMKYDELALTSDASRRKAIQQDINRLNVAASQFAIPNEFNRLTAMCGGTELNAGTSYDFTFYHNTFMPQYIERWCELNSHRFIHPVFRLFQGELETVYEEKNMYSDDPAAMLLEQITGKFLAGTPYAYPIVGSTENLKNPKLSEMEAFYKKYYVASNMGLILSGDIRVDDLKPLLERTFGRLERGVKPVREKIVAPAIQGQPVEKFLFPMPIIGMSAMLFRGPSEYDADAPALKVAMSLLSNENKTGLLDELTNKNRVYMSMAQHMGFNQTGVLMVAVVPKLLCRVKTAENLCLTQLEKLLNGEFTDEQLQAVKRMMVYENESSLESISKRSDEMVAAMSSGLSWSDYMKLKDAVASVTREDVINVSRKYFTENFYRFHKKNGRCKAEQIAKPEYTPVKPKHSDAESAFARHLGTIDAGQAPELRYVDFDKDVVKTPLAGGNRLYSTTNPLNDNFSLIINFHKGTMQDRLLDAAAGYVEELGTDSLDVKALGSAMQALGAKLEIVANEQSTIMVLQGEDSQLESTLDLLSHFMEHMKADKEKLDDAKDAAGPAEKSFWDESDQVFAALVSKVMHGDRSSFLTRLTAKEMKKTRPEQLIASFKQLYDCRYDMSYTGTKDGAQVAQAIKEHLPQLAGGQENAMQEIPLQAPQQPTVYLFDMPSSRQTIVGAYLPLADVTSDRDRARLQMWGEYFGGDMSSVLFQEVREFRSMAYAAQGVAMTPQLARSTTPSGYMALVATQADKTMQVIGLLDTLFNDMPVNKGNMPLAKLNLANEINNSYPTFRGMPLIVSLSERIGYNRDANMVLGEQLSTLDDEEILKFYQERIQGKPYQLMIVGNVKKLDLKALARYGTIVKVKKADIFKTK
jgi:predicted Zn-dependent peptidase